MSKKKRAAPSYYTVGVRFLSGDVAKPYTYRIARSKTVHLGQELIAETLRGPALVVVVRIDKTPQDNGPYEYRYLTRKVTAL